MTDYTGLKRLCAALISANEAYLDDSCSLENQERFHAADDALQDALPPEVVLAIIAENELLRESPGMGAIRSLRGDCADLMAECDRLKAENEALRLRCHRLDEDKQSMAETHVLYTWLRKKCHQPSNDIVAVQMNIGHDWVPVHDLDRDLRTMIDREEP
ncbi:hypothetical protein [Pseudomonas sp. R16(2017)]|uniref:hypothetical protein n=1 Tax=Pseudomonas sp. R16(2017) TaxID=1981704 RepID=UPI000A1DEE42|nr:hypothetical protein [Pseudomonas sp. R16(2017)]